MLMAIDGTRLQSVSYRSQAMHRNLFEDKNKELGGSRDWSFDCGSHRGLPTAKLRFSTKLTNTALARFSFWGQYSCGTFEKMLTRWLSSALPTIIHDRRLQQPDRIAKPSTPRASTPQMDGRIMPRDKPNLGHAREKSRSRPRSYGNQAILAFHIDVY